MPQNQGPIVIQNQRSTGALGMFGSQLLSNLGQGLGQAAGGFLQDLINPNPQEDVLRASAEAQRIKNDQDILSAYEEYQKKRGAGPDPVTAKAFFSQTGKDEEEVERLVQLATPTMANDEFAVLGKNLRIVREENNKPFSSGTGAGPMANVPPPPSAEPAVTPKASPEKPGNTLPAANLAPLTSSTISAEGDSTTRPAPSAQEEQATKNVLSVAPEVVADTVKPTEPALAPEALPPVEKVNAPQPLSQEAKITAMRKMRNAQGALAAIGQAFVSEKTGVIDPAQRGLAMNALATVDRDMADIINMQRIAEGEDPSTLSGKNYRQMAFYATQRELLNNPAWRSRATPDMIARAEENSKQYENAYMSDDNWSSTDWSYVDKLKANLVPKEWSQGAMLQFMYMQDQFAHQAKESDKNRAVNVDQFNKTYTLDTAKLGLAQQEFAKRSGLIDAQVEAMGISNEEARSMQGTKLEEFRFRMQQAKQVQDQTMKEYKLRLDTASISNMQALQGLVDTSLSQAISVTQLEVNDEQRRAMSAQGALTKIQAAQDTLYKTMSSSRDGNSATNLVRKYQDKPSSLDSDYAKMPGSQKAEIDALAKQIGGDNPASIDRAQAMAAIKYPSYRDYITKRASYTQQATAFSKQIEMLAKNDVSIGDRIKATAEQLGGPNAANAKAQYQELIGKYLNANVVRVNQDLARKGITGVDPMVGMDFIKNNPELIPYMLGQASVAQGKVSTSGSASTLDPNEVATMYYMGRSVKGADGSVLSPTAFAAVTAHGKNLKQLFGPRLQDAYATYTIFARGGH